MSMPHVFPTRNCVHIGHPDRPLNAPPQAPANVLSYLAQVADLTEPAEIRWQLDAPLAGRERPGLERRAREARHVRNVRPEAALDGPDSLPTGPGRTVPGGPDREAAATASDPTRLRQRLCRALDGAMRGRILHAIPFASDDLLGILLTDQPAAATAVATVAHAGTEPLERIAAGGRWVTIVHSSGGRDGENCLVRFLDCSETWAVGPHAIESLLDTAVANPAAA